MQYVRARAAAAAAAALTPESASDRWITVLEAVAFSPIRTQVKPTGKPEIPTEALIATVTRLAPLIGQIAALFNITATPGAHSPRPLRPTRPIKHVRAKASPAIESAPAPIIIGTTSAEGT